MAVHADSPKMLNELIKLLHKDGPKAYKMKGHIRFQIKSALKLEEFIVNKWPNPTVILQKPSPNQSCSYLQNCCLIYASQAEDVDAFLENNIFNWNQSVTFAGTAPNLHSRIAEIARRKGGSVDPFEEIEDTYTLVLNHPVEERELPAGYHYSGPIRLESDIDMINSAWKFGGTESSREYVKYCADYMHSIGVKDDDGNLIAFELQSPYGCNMMLHVDSQHRGKGLAKCVITKLAKIVQEDNQQVYSTIITDNEVSLRLHKGLGFEIADGCNMSWFRYYAKSECHVGKRACCM